MNEYKPGNKYVLLMTACIKPKNLNRPSFRIDPVVRLADYKKALDFWLAYDDKRITGIVFAENSGYSLDELMALVKTRNIYNRTIEFLQFEESGRLNGVHYGFSDMEIVDHAIDNSKIIRADSILIKTTGRLYFPKLNRLLDTEDKMQYDFFADSRDYKLGKIEKRYLVTTIFLVKPIFYKEHLYNVKWELPAGKASHMETLYFRIIKSLKGYNTKLGFPCRVDPVGIGAHSSNNYDSFKKRIESSLLFFMRKLLPSSKSS